MEKCCENRAIHSTGWDDGDGHHEPVNIERASNGGWYVKAEWFAMRVSHCPWCGIELEKPPERSVCQVDELSAVEVMDALDRMSADLNDDCNNGDED